MDHLKFFLRPLKDNKTESVIWLYATWNSKRLRISTEIRVKNSLWQKNKIKGNGFALENKKLYDIENKANTTVTNAKLNSEILSPDKLKIELLSIISPDRANVKLHVKHHNLKTFIEEFITANPQELKPSTLSKYHQLLKNRLLPFVKRYGKDYLNFDSVNMEWDELFVKFCTEHNDAKNTLDTHRKNLKKIMKYSYDKELHSNRKYTAIKRSQEQTDNIYLTESEIIEIYRLKVPGDLQLPKDLLVFSCLTGLRVSDLLGLRKEDWRGDSIYVKPRKTEKTGEVLRIPLRKTALSIIKKYKGSFPVITEGKYNDATKKICKNIPSLQVDYATYFTRGMNERIKEVQKKWELVHPHTGRRSFATNEYRRKTPIFHIMAITGHRDVGTFMKYIKVKQADMANDMALDFSKRDF
jgi:integrase